MKRAQMEIMGLVVIVILLTLGMIFMVTFALRAEPTGRTFTPERLAYSTMGALMKMTVDEPNCVEEVARGAFPEIEKDLFEDCAINKDTMSLYTCRGRHSCDFLSEFLPEMLERTLGNWNQKYEFHSELVPLLGEKPIEIIPPIKKNGGCTGKRSSSDRFPLQTDSGVVYSWLYVCS